MKDRQTQIVMSESISLSTLSALYLAAQFQQSIPFGKTSSFELQNSSTDNKQVNQMAN